MNSLHLVYTGFNLEERITEDHEILFLIGENTDELISNVMKKSRLPLGFHLDFLLKISVIDGYKVELQKNPPTESKIKLYFGYMGGEAEDRYIEDHELLFVVAEDIEEVKPQLKEKTKLGDDPHVDYMKEIIELDGMYIHLVKVGGDDKIEKILGYTKL